VFVEVQVRSTERAADNIFNPADGDLYAAWGSSSMFNFTLGSLITFTPMWNQTAGNWPLGTFPMDQYGAGSLGAIMVGVTTNAPSIDVQPRPVVVHAHDSTSFSVSAFGLLLGYQWSLNGTNIPGATSRVLALQDVRQSDLGSYSVTVTNYFGSATSSNALLSMYPFLQGPFTGAVTYWGKDATLSVQAWGTGPLSYQWFKDGSAILNATNQDLTLTNIQFTDAGMYSVIVNGPLGSVTNTPAQVVVNAAGVSLGLYPGVTVNGVVGYNYVIQRSSDLTDTNSWVTKANLTLTQPVELWVDTNTDASLPSNPHHFYRVLPGP
jgi:hypothetical protein